MARFTADADALRALATKADRAADSAHVTGSLATVADAGHAGLAAAMSDFVTKIDTTWGERMSATRDLATGLRRTAGIYESADADGETRIRGGGGGVF